ncbi:MAG: helix-turn-helix domain-containing protein [Rhodothermales bacterium]
MTIDDQIQAAVRAAVREEVRAVVLSTLPEAIRRATEPEHMTREEAADYLGISTRSLDYRIKERRLPSVKRGRRVLIPTDALREYLDEATIAARGADG